MFIDHLWLRDMRNYQELDLEFPPAGLTFVHGDNGQGKTNLLEALGYLATLKSFRGAVNEALVRVGEQQAIVRGSGQRAERSLLVECEINTVGRNRTLLNKQAVRRSADIVEAFAVSVFSPSDLELIQGGPAHRRDYIDDTLAMLDGRNAVLQSELDRVLRQRNTLLRQAGGRLTPEIMLTLDVWDDKLATAGEALGEKRSDLTEQLLPYVLSAYAELAGVVPSDLGISVQMATEWREADGADGLRKTLLETRDADVGRGLTTVGPHRDEVMLRLASMPARTHASQGEQRTMALALRLAAHQLLTDHLEAPPILLLDDVFSELDEGRTHRLVQNLPTGQTFLTSALAPPPGFDPQLRLEVDSGTVRI